jgi:hypothetical protein
VPGEFDEGAEDELKVDTTMKTNKAPPHSVNDTGSSGSGYVLGHNDGSGNSDNSHLFADKQQEREEEDASFRCLRAVMGKCVHSVRIMGSGVLDLCYVACGRLDAVYAGVAGEIFNQ